MARLFCMLGIFVFLIGVGVAEELYIHDITKQLNTRSTSLDLLIESNENNLTDKKITSEFKQLQKFWQDKERNLTFFINFEKIKPINESIIKLEGALAQDDFSVAVENVKLLVTYSKNLRYMAGINLHNIL